MYNGYLSAFAKVLFVRWGIWFALMLVVVLLISPPTLLIDENGQGGLPVSQVIVVKLAVDSIAVNIYIGLCK